MTDQVSESPAIIYRQLPYSYGNFIYSKVVHGLHWLTMKMYPVPKQSIFVNLLVLYNEHVSKNSILALVFQYDPSINNTSVM